MGHAGVFKLGSSKLGRYDSTLMYSSMVYWRFGGNGLDGGDGLLIAMNKINEYTLKTENNRKVYV